MNWISTKNMTNENAPEGKVLVQYLEPVFGEWDVDVTTAVFDNPNCYNEPNLGEGWVTFSTGRKINVIAYAEITGIIEDNTTAQLNQIEFKDKFGSFHPNLGSIGE